MLVICARGVLAVPCAALIMMPLMPVFVNQPSACGNSKGQPTI